MWPPLASPDGSVKITHLLREKQEEPGDFDAVCFHFGRSLGGSLKCGCILKCLLGCDVLEESTPFSRAECKADGQFVLAEMSTPERSPQASPRSSPRAATQNLNYKAFSKPTTEIQKVSGKKKEKHGPLGNPHASVESRYEADLSIKTRIENLVANRLTKKVIVPYTKVSL